MKMSFVKTKQLKCTIVLFCPNSKYLYLAWLGLQEFEITTKCASEVSQFDILIIAGRSEISVLWSKYSVDILLRTIVMTGPGLQYVK